jgi:hypothetical protein
LVVVISLTAGRTGQFPTTNHHKANEISRGLRHRHMHAENYAVATLRVFALDPKLLFFRHVNNLGGARAHFKHKLAGYPRLYPEYLRFPYGSKPSLLRNNQDQYGDELRQSFGLSTQKIGEISATRLLTDLEDFFYQ